MTCDATLAGAASTYKKRRLKLPRFSRGLVSEMHSLLADGASPTVTLIGYRDRGTHGRPLNIRCRRRRTSTPRRPQNRRRPPTTNRTHISTVAPNMASQSVQCFGKKKTATGTIITQSMNKMIKRNSRLTTMIQLSPTARYIYTQYPAIETRSRIIYLQCFVCYRPERVLSRLTESLFPSSSPSSCDSRSTSPS